MSPILIYAYSSYGISSFINDTDLVLAYFA